MSLSQAPSDEPETVPLPPWSGLDPLALLDAVMGNEESGDWNPPPPEVLEPWFHGFDQFGFINRGGMGAVYHARQKSLDRKVAIKILPPELGHDTDFVERFHQEARLLARLQHPHIVGIHDFGSTGAGHLFIVMEYVAGTSLSETSRAQRLPVVRVLEIFSQVCEALQFAHDQGVIHRDIKPTNILLDEHGRARVADFGLAKLTPKNVVARKTSTHTRVGRALGTPGYSAPEQRRAEPEVDQRADIFSLGITLYETLTGQMPVGVFEAPSRKIGSPAALDRVILRALQERPELRYQTAAQMKKAIEPIALKLGAPSLQKQILQRPLTAAVILIQLLVVGWLLWDKLARTETPLTLGPEAEYSSGSLQTLAITPRLALLPEPMSWTRARSLLESHATYRMASIRDAGEQAEIVRMLKDRNMRVPVWTGGHQEAGTDQVVWADGSPLSYENWMPEGPKPAVIMSEIQAKNQDTLRLEGGDSPDWVELHNPGPEPVDLVGWRFLYRDSSKVSEAWIKSTPEVSTVIPAGGYRLIYFGGRRTIPGELSFAFNLEAQGGILRWTDPRGRVIQVFRSPWPQFEEDTSIGCAADGTDWGLCEEPTPGEPNTSRISSIVGPSAEADIMRCVLLLMDFDGRWTMEMPNLRTWVLVEKKP